MNRTEYLDALRFAYRVETAGSIAGEVGMLLREDRVEKRKLDLVRRIEAGNKRLCLNAFAKEEVAAPPIEPALYRAAYKIGLRFGEGTWDSFLDRFEATVHPNEFTRWIHDKDGCEIEHAYAGVDMGLMRHLVSHEALLRTFVDLEREGRGEVAIEGMTQFLTREYASGGIGPLDPVGW